MNLLIVLTIAACITLVFYNLRELQISSVNEEWVECIMN